MSSALSLANEIKSQTEKFEQTSDDDARRSVLSAARKLVIELEKPSEYVSRVTWAEPARNIAILVGFDLDIFNQLVSAPPQQGLSSSDIANVSKAEPNLVSRLMKLLASMNVVEEAGPDRYIATKLCHTLTDPNFVGGMVVGIDMISPALIEFPPLLKELGYKSPKDCNDAAVQRAFKTNLSTYEWMTKHRPEMATHFMRFMSVYRKGIPKWWEPNFYPIRDRLAHESLTKETTLLVDIGGGLGHDLQAIYEHHGANLPGRLILEDVPEVIGMANASGALNDRIERVDYDYHNPQPFAGARAYHMHSILHNWPDEVCHDILGPVTEAMKKGYSKLLIFDIVMPDVDASTSQTSLDILMSVVFGAQERTRKQWEALLQPHGLHITGIWSAAGGEESLIEAELKS